MLESLESLEKQVLKTQMERLTMKGRTSVGHLIRWKYLVLSCRLHQYPFAANLATGMTLCKAGLKVYSFEKPRY